MHVYVLAGVVGGGPTGPSSQAAIEPFGKGQTGGRKHLSGEESPMVSFEPS